MIDLTKVDVFQHVMVVTDKREDVGFGAIGYILEINDELEEPILVAFENPIQKVKRFKINELTIIKENY